MINYKVKSKDFILTVKVKFPSNSNLNERELDFFSRKLFRGFFKPQKLKKNILLYTGPVGISLYERLKRPISKYDFFFIIEQIVDSSLKLQKNGFPWNKVVWDIQHSFINETTKEVQLIYLPIDNFSAGNNILTFIESIIYSSKPFDEHDPDFISRFVYFIKSLPGYDPGKIESYIIKEDRSVVNTIKKHTTGSSGFMTDKPKDYYDHYEKKKQMPDEEDTGLLEEEEDEDTGLLDEENDEATGLLNEEPYICEHMPADEATGLLDESEGTALLEDYGDDNDGATGLLTEDGNVIPARQTVSVKKHFPTLHRVLTDENISVNKPVFRLGKEKSYVDYFVASNVAVSRSHADIITRGNKYYVRDLNSKNHTYINDQIIPIQVEVEIHDGDRLKLANEEFVFNI